MTGRTTALLLALVASPMAATATAQTTTTTSTSTSSSTSTSTTGPPTTSTTVPNPCAGQACTNAPPPAFLAGAGGGVRLDQGSFCWTSPAPNAQGHLISLCADELARVPDAILRVQAGETLTLRFGAAMSPSSVTRQRGGQSTPLTAGNPTRFVVDLPAGVHEIGFFTRWLQGDASYGLRLDVRAAPRTIALTG